MVKPMQYMSLNLLDTLYILVMNLINFNTI